MRLFSFLLDTLFIVLGYGPDVVTVTSGSAGNAGSTAAELITYMSARLLEVAEFNTILDFVVEFNTHFPSNTYGRE